MVGASTLISMSAFRYLFGSVSVPGAMCLFTGEPGHCDVSGSGDLSCPAFTADFTAHITFVFDTLGCQGVILSLFVAIYIEKLS
jgi:hypothetical protein